MRNSRVILFIALSIVAPFAQANLLVNGDFEDMPNWGGGFQGDGSYTAFTGTQIPGWIIEANHAATIHNTLTYPYISGNYSLNTDGEGWNQHNVDMYQDFASNNGSQYTLTFDWKNWFSDSTVRLDVSLTDTVTSSELAHGNYGLSTGLHSEVFTFTGTGNAIRLRVKCSPESGYNDNTFIVDNFSVQAVPEPMSMIALGMGCTLLMKRRRSAK